MKRKDHVEPAELERAIATARASDKSAGSLWEQLESELSVDPSVLAQALLRWHGVAVVGEDEWATVELVQDKSMSHEGCVLQTKTRRLFWCRDPWAPAALQVFARLQGEVQLALRLPGQELKKGKAPAENHLTHGSATEEVPVVGFVDAAIRRAYQEGASDVHFETDRQGIRVKYRLDGVMVVGERLAGQQQAEEVISRIKVLAHLDITERRRPQDGRIHWSSEEEALDLRVSVMPSIFGEDAVLRLLDKAQLRHSHQAISLDGLGFDPNTASVLRSLASRPHGMLLMTGPTGSGKTTTVYAALSEVNTGLEKIITIEDPVEYELAGVLQIPVNEQKGLTFATGLRSILRHDPDKILVGEIRDAETAEIAVQSALTGHLVFTTVHANSLFDVLGRFQHFGIDHFALASALNGVVVQRLLRRLCANCFARREITAAEAERFELLGLAAPREVPVAVGCSHCRGTGYRGRFVVAEVHDLQDDVRELILHRASILELKSKLSARSQETLLGLALRKVLEEQTSNEEVARVVGFA